MKTDEYLLEIFNRRASVRSFTGEEVSDEIIDKIISCSIKAPSSGNMQPWEFVVIKSEEKKTEIVEATFTGYFASGSNHQTWLLDAGFLMVVGANIKRTKARYGDLGEYWPIIDTAAAIENGLLAASALGLGSCWIGGYDEEKIKRTVKFPSYIKPVGVIAIGHTTTTAVQQNRLPIKLVKHDECYGMKKCKG